MKTLIIGLVLILTGCIQGCAVVQKDVQRNDEEIITFQAPPKIIFVKTQDRLESYCGKALVGKVLGCKISDCTIVMFKPKGFEDHRKLETLGHELTHCIEGGTEHTEL